MKSTTADLLQFQAFLHSFVQIEQALFDEFCDGMETLIFKKGHHVQVPGAATDKIYFVVSGTIRAYFVTDEGVEITDYFYAENIFATEYDACIQQQPATMYMQAIEKTRVIAFDYTKVTGLYDQSHSFERLGRLVAEWGFVMERYRSKFLLLNSPENRYRLLIENEPHLLLRYPHHYIASYMAITPESFSRIKRRLMP